MAQTAYIGLGSNMGDRRNYLHTAVTLLQEHPEIRLERTSSIYETAPVGYTEQPNFLNMAIAVQTTLQPEHLLQVMLDAERKLGRVRDVRWGPRTVDLDLLLYGNASINSEQLELPHPRMWERAFVLIPLREVWLNNEQNDEVLERIEQALTAVNGKEDVRLWEQSSWRSASERSAN